MAEETRKVTVERKVLAKNAEGAEENRQWLHERRIASINLISSPGTGKPPSWPRRSKRCRAAGAAR